MSISRSIGLAFGAASTLIACATGSIDSDAPFLGPFDSGAPPAQDAARREASAQDSAVKTPPRDAGREAMPEASLSDTFLSDDVDAEEPDSSDAGGPPPPDASIFCKGTVALAGGTSSSAFGASSVNGGAWTVTSLSAGSMSSNPALVPFGGGFVALFGACASNQLEFSQLTSSTWSAPASAFATACAGPAEAVGPVGLAAVGTTLDSVYLGTDDDFFHGSYTATGWDCESDPLSPSDGSPSFGPSAPTVATLGTSLVAAFDGSDGRLYTQSLTSGVWAAAESISGASVGTVPPTLIALTGGSSDLLLVYENVGDNKLYAVTQTSGTWSAPMLTNVNAFTAAPTSMAPTAGGGAVLVFLGTDGNAYGMTFDPAATTPWTAPVAIASGTTTLPSPPTIAAGICGVDATAAFVQPGGIELVTISSGAWSAPTVVPATASMTFATIATSP